MSMTNPTPMPSPSAGPSIKKKKKTKTIGDLVSSSASSAGGTVPKGSQSGQIGLDGRPLKSKIVVGSMPWKAPLLPGVEPGIIKETQYAKGDGQTWFTTLKNKERAEFLTLLSQIPGLYPKGKALRPQDIVTFASSQTMIPARPEDITAIEKVMRYADTVGYDVDQAIKYLSQNPALAQSFFNLSELTKGAKKVSITPAAILALEVSETFQDYLDMKPDKDTILKYTEMVNKLEVNRGGGVLQTERQQILLDLVQDKARTLIKDDAPDSLMLQRGALGGAYNALRKTYRDFGVTVDDKTIYKQAIQSIRSRQAFDNIVQKVQTQAQVAFPALEKYYSQGLSTRDALANYIGLYSKIYNVPEMDIDLDKLYPVLKGKELMSMDDWKKYLYSLPEFKNTELYRERSFNDAQTLMRNFFGGNL